jgi:hypothetical protein
MQVSIRICSNSKLSNAAVGWEPIFSPILKRLGITDEDGEQLRFLHYGEEVQENFGTALQL